MRSLTRAEQSGSAAGAGERDKHRHQLAANPCARSTPRRAKGENSRSTHAPVVGSRGTRPVPPGPGGRPRASRTSPISLCNALSLRSPVLRPVRRCSKLRRSRSQSGSHRGHHPVRGPASDSWWTLPPAYQRRGRSEPHSPPAPPPTSPPITTWVPLAEPHRAAADLFHLFQHVRDTNTTAQPRSRIPRSRS